MRTAKLNPKYYGLVDGVTAHLRLEKTFPAILERLQLDKENQQQNAVVLWDGTCEEWLSELLGKNDRAYLNSHIRRITISLSLEQNENVPTFTLFAEPSNPLYSISNYEIRVTAPPIHIDSVFISYDGSKVKGSNLQDLLSWCE
jgi:hypothetical protein